MYLRHIPQLQGLGSLAEKATELKGSAQLDAKTPSRQDNGTEEGVNTPMAMTEEEEEVWGKSSGSYPLYTHIQCMQIHTVCVYVYMCVCICI